MKYKHIRERSYFYFKIQHNDMTIVFPIAHNSNILHDLLYINEFNDLNFQWLFCNNLALILDIAAFDVQFQSVLSSWLVGVYNLKCSHKN